MSGNVFMTRMPAGIPGSVSRLSSGVLEPNQIGAAPVTFGAPVKLENGLVTPLAGGETADAIYGFLVRPYPTMSTANAFGVADAPENTLQSVMRSGYMVVRLAAGTAAKNGKVYVRVSGGTVGDIEAASGAGLVAIDAIFMGEADASGNTEISFNI